VSRAAADSGASPLTDSEIVSSIPRVSGVLGISVSRGYRSMTRRQAEALNAVYQAADSGPGVHYTELAQRLGISKWSAYDMLLILEERGLVCREYEPPAGGSPGGRPRVLFRPTAQGLQALRGRVGASEEPLDWERLCRRLLQRIACPLPPRGALPTDRHAREGSPLGRCADLIASLVELAQDSLSRVHVHRALHRVLRSPIPPATKISTVCGTIAASLGRLKSGDERARIVQDLLVRLEVQTAQLRAAEHSALLVFVAAALRRAATPGL